MSRLMGASEEGTLAALKATRRALCADQNWQHDTNADTAHYAITGRVSASAFLVAL
jgi:hypothetical protein